MKILFISRYTLRSQAGGDTIQIDETAKYLRQLGHKIEICTNPAEINVEEYDLIHFFNLSRPADVLSLLKYNIPLIVSSIYLDYSEIDKQRKGLSGLISKALGSFGFEYIKTIGRWIKGKERFPGFQYILLGQKASMKKVLSKTSHVLTASDQEIKAIQKDLSMNFKASVVNLGSEHIGASEIDQTTRKGIICVARIERRKNQLKLIEATNQLPYTLRVIGEAATNQQDYYQSCKVMANDNTQFIGFKSGDELDLEFRSAKVHAMVSYYETTGLSTLEALKLGGQAVISDRGGQKETFENHAFYCDPDDPSSIKKAIEEAYACEKNHSDWVKENFSWKKAAKQISDIYTNLASSK